MATSHYKKNINEQKRPRRNNEKTVGVRDNVGKRDYKHMERFWKAKRRSRQLERRCQNH